MANSARLAPLEVFLSEVMINRAPLPVYRVAPIKALADRSKAEIGRTVALAILGQAKGAISAVELAQRSELGRDWYREIVGELESDGLIARDRDGSGYLLTERGREAAAIERGRALRP